MRDLFLRQTRLDSGEGKAEILDQAFEFAALRYEVDVEDVTRDRMVADTFCNLGHAGGFGEAESGWREQKGFASARALSFSSCSCHSLPPACMVILCPSVRNWPLLMSRGVAWVLSSSI